MSIIRVISIGFLAVLSLIVAISFGKLVEDVPANQIVVIQSPVAGQLAWYDGRTDTGAGLKWQGFGEVTYYSPIMTYDFAEKGLELRFNDGGHATMFGLIQCEMPGDQARLSSLHRRFRGEDQVRRQLVETMTNKAVYLTGTLMSSKESYAEKRNDLIHYVSDQVQNGVYRTRQKSEWIKDPVTGQDKQVINAEIVLNADGKPERQEDSVLGTYGIHCSNFTIKRMPYDPVVEAQIKQQQQITMDVQTSMAEKIKAEQRAQTVEQQGKANATEAKWAQETVKAREVTLADQMRQVALIEADRQKQVFVTNALRDKAVAETAAQQRLAVAEFDRKAADQKKAELTLLGEGEAARKKSVIEADGALEQKLATYERVMGKAFDSLRGSAITPGVVLGGASGTVTAGGNINQLIDTLTAQAARNLALDMSMSTRSAAPGGQPTR